MEEKCLPCQGTVKLEGGGKRGSDFFQQGLTTPSDLRVEGSESPVVPWGASQSRDGCLPGLRTHCRLQWIEEDGDLVWQYPRNRKGRHR